MQRIRHAVGLEEVPRGASKAVKDFIEESRQMSHQEQLQIVARTFLPFGVGAGESKCPRRAKNCAKCQPAKKKPILV
jgi:hypothetical protein